MIAAASFVGGTTADAATCALPVRYSATSDTTYLTAPGPVDTLTEIKAACPGAPLVQSSPGVWELNSDLVVQGGARLNLSGDVKELRLQSLPSGLTKDVSALIAQYGTININGREGDVVERDGAGHRSHRAQRRHPRARVRPGGVVHGGQHPPSSRGWTS